MSDEEFLARWSRRKREARTPVDAPPPTEIAEAPNPAPSGIAETSADTEVDLSSLPPIESITGATDITAFLRKGIPAELSRAALRRAWASDPAIRDFIGLAENAWDFNDPNAMPGFGPLDYSAEQLEALVGRIVGSVRSAAESLATAVAEEQQDRQSVDSERDPVCESRPEATADLATPAQSLEDEPSAASIAVQPGSPETDRGDKVSFRRRTHGGALPRRLPDERP
jgi:hypothetical protein